LLIFLRRDCGVHPEPLKSEIASLRTRNRWAQARNDGEGPGSQRRLKDIFRKLPEVSLITVCRWLLILVFSFAALAGCSASGRTLEDNQTGRPDEDRLVSQKLDPALLIELNSSAAQEADGVIAVLIKTTGPITPSQRAELERVGVVIGSVLGDIVTARIPRGRIIDAVRFDFIVRMEKANKLRPK
jgi:hypothetical protein